MNKYKACIFDLDGTLADTLQSIAYFGNSTLKAFGLPEIPAQRYRQLVGDGAAVLMERMLREVGADGPGVVDIAAFRAEYDRRYAEDPMALVGAYPGLPEVLGRLHERGYMLGVLSNKPDDMVVYIANTLYPGLLNAVHGQREGIPRKPDPAALLAMAQELGVSPAEVLYIGDSGVDMDTGLGAGMDTCGVLWGFREREELEGHGAMYLAGDPLELQNIIEKR